MTYQVTARPWAFGWELHVEGVGVTRCRTLAAAEDTVRDYLAALDDLDEVTEPIEITQGDVVPEFGRFFTRFTEDNDYEGETWTFWLQRDGNEDALRWLGRLIRDDEADGDKYAQYSLDLNVTLSERDVDLLVEYGGAGYMRLHSKVVGRLTVTPDLDLDVLYKGGIVKLFAETAGAGEGDAT